MEGLVISDAVKDLIINIINIILLFVIVRTLAYKPVKKFLNDRRERIAAEKRDAEEQKAKAQEMYEQYERLLTENRNSRAEIISDAERAAKANAAEIIENAKKMAQEITDKARAETEKEREAAVASLKKDVTGMAFDISKRLLSREITDKDNQKIADEFFEQYSEG